MVPQDELETEMALTFEHRDPDVIGNPYLVVGTVDTRIWKASLGEERMTIPHTLANAADFKRVYGLDPGGWKPAK